MSMAAEAKKLSAAEQLDELNRETGKLHAWIRTQANAPAQRPWFTDTGGATGAGELAKGRVAANQMKMLAHRWRWREIYPYLKKISDIARAADVKRFVYVSSSEVYGTARHVPIDEDHPLQAQSPYAASKIASDQLALSFHRSFDVPVVILRPFNTYGPRQSGRAIIPTVIAQIASGAREIRLGSLHPTRDFSFVTDTVRGFMHAAVAEKAVGEVFNTGSGFEISVADTTKLIAELMHADVDVVRSHERVRPAASEVERLCARISKAADQLHWTPDYAGRDGFIRGLEQTIAWFRNPDNLRRYKAERYNI